MKKYLFVVLVLTGLVGCDPSSAFYCRKTVEQAFPNGEVSLSPDAASGLRFIVRDKDGSIWYVETLSFKNYGITKKELIFKGKQ